MQGAKEGRLIKTFSVLLEFLHVILAVLLYILIIVLACFYLCTF